MCQTGKHDVRHLKNLLLWVYQLVIGELVKAERPTPEVQEIGLIMAVRY
jgi:hypothetical protein